MENNEKKEQKIQTVASVFKTLGTVGAKDRKNLATKIVLHLKKCGQTKNVKGKVIDVKHVTQQVSAMVRDINNKRGLKTQSWWSKYTVVENDNVFKLVSA